MYISSIVTVHVSVISSLKINDINDEDSCNLIYIIFKNDENNKRTFSRLNGNLMERTSSNWFSTGWVLEN